MDKQKYVCIHADLCSVGSCSDPGRHIKDPCAHAVPHVSGNKFGCDHMHCGKILEPLGALVAACCMPIVDEVVCRGAKKCGEDCLHAKPHAQYDQCEVVCPTAKRLKLPKGCKPTGKQLVRPFQ